MADKMLQVPTVHIEDSSGSEWSDYECDAIKPRWSFNEYLLQEGTHKELLLCMLDDVS